MKKILLTLLCGMGMCFSGKMFASIGQEYRENHPSTETSGNILLNPEETAFRIKQVPEIFKGIIANATSAMSMEDKMRFGGLSKIQLIEKFLTLCDAVQKDSESNDFERATNIEDLAYVIELLYNSKQKLWIPLYNIQKERIPINYTMVFLRIYQYGSDKVNCCMSIDMSQFLLELYHLNTPNSDL